MSKNTATEMNSFFSKMPEKVLKEQAQHILDKSSKELKHTIGIVNIYQMPSLVLSINKKSLKMKWFDTEQEAIDYYLDLFGMTKEYNQTDLFSHE